MGNATKLSGRTLQITGLDADWNLDTDMAGTTKLKISGITFIPSGPGDICIIKDAADGSSSAATLFQVKCNDATDQRRAFHGGQWCAPCFNVSDLTLSSAAAAKILIDLQ